MMENDSRTEEQVDADWRRVTASIFGTNTGAEPKVDGESWGVRGEKLCTELGKQHLKKESMKKRDGQICGKGEGSTLTEVKLMNNEKAEDHL
jgi:hypothetical protein